jgi:hypothetical protein
MPLFTADKTLQPVFGESSSCKKLLLTSLVGDGVTTYTSGAGASVLVGLLEQGQTLAQMRLGMLD